MTEQNEPGRGAIGYRWPDADDDGIGWLAAATLTEEPQPEERVVFASGRTDFVLGAALAGLNLFVTIGLIAAWLLQTAGVFVELSLDQDPGDIETPAGFVILVTGSLLGLAVGVGGFAMFAWKRLPSYYWPLVGIAIALGSSVVAARS